MRNYLTEYQKGYQYQSPMGKVKNQNFGDMEIALQSKYQSPMGKVKNNIVCCVFIIFHRYRFVKLIFQKKTRFCSLILVIN